jgi:hypothetical protein
LARRTENKHLSGRLAVETDSSPISKGSEDTMNDNQIEVLSKAIDTLVEIRRKVASAGWTPAHDETFLCTSVVQLSKAQVLVLALAGGEEWNP